MVSDAKKNGSSERVKLVREEQTRPREFDPGERKKKKQKKKKRKTKEKQKKKFARIISKENEEEKPEKTNPGLPHSTEGSTGIIPLSRLRI